MDDKVTVALLLFFLFLLVVCSCMAGSYGMEPSPEGINPDTLECYLFC